MQAMRDLIERMQAELKFNRTKIEALNFEIARLKRWRFGSSSESLDTGTQAVLFDAILADTAIEDLAAKEATKPPATAPSPKRQAVRQALPAGLPRLLRVRRIPAAAQMASLNRELPRGWLCASAKRISATASSSSWLRNNAR